MLGPLVINRQDQFPVATISFNLAPGAALGDAVKAIDQAKRSIEYALTVCKPVLKVQQKFFKIL